MVVSNILIQGLEHTVGIKGNALQWFGLHLSHRLQFVHGNGECSSHMKVSHGVPQGSVLGSIPFSLCLLYYLILLENTAYRCYPVIFNNESQMT